MFPFSKLTLRHNPCWWWTDCLGMPCWRGMHTLCFRGWSGLWETADWASWTGAWKCLRRAKQNPGATKPFWWNAWPWILTASDFRRSGATTRPWLSWQACLWQERFLSGSRLWGWDPVVWVSSCTKSSKRGSVPGPVYKTCPVDAQSRERKRQFLLNLFIKTLCESIKENIIVISLIITRLSVSYLLLSYYNWYSFLLIIFP